MIQSVRQLEQPVAADAGAGSVLGERDSPSASAEAAIPAATAGVQSAALAKAPGASEFGSGRRTASVAVVEASVAAAAAVVVVDVVAVRDWSLGRS